MKPFLEHITLTYRKIAWLIAMLFFFVPDGFGQMADTLKEVNVRNKKKPSQDERLNNFSAGQKLKTFDSTTLAQYKLQSVANVLMQQTQVFVKSYGLNGLATLNIRGSSAAQSQVLWNGVPVNNAALGMADISLLPVSLINKLHIVYGSSAALWGSGNVGGALLLETDAPTFNSKTQYEIAFGAGSFGQYQAGVKLQAGSKRISFNTNVFSQTAKNNFSYRDETGRKIETKNALLRGIALQQQIGYRYDDKNIFRFVAWYQNYERQIPAALFEPYSEKERKDQSLRLLLDWNRKSFSNHLYARTAFLQDRMQFDDDTIHLHSANTSYQYFFETGWKKRFSERHQLLLFMPLQFSWMKPDTIIRQQSKYALAAAYSYNDRARKFTVSINLRDEWINDYNIFLPGIGASYAFTKTFSVRANAQRTFRAPTLNELYYNPGGNENLKAEHGWSAEAGYKMERRNEKFLLLHELSAFNRIIDDWILWLGGAIWTPHNIATVHSKGIEIENLFSFSVNKWKLHLGLNASYVAATTMKSDLPNDGSIGRQIPYTPKVSGLASFGFTYRSLYFNYNYNYTGLRYMNSDETGAMSAYYISNVQLSYLLNIRATKIYLSAQANNIFNHSYEIISARPMPGLNWLLAIRVTAK